LNIRIFLAVFLITFIFYLKCLSFSFVWDDIANFNTLSRMSLLEALKPSQRVISLNTLFASNWRPLTNGLFILFNNFSPQFAHLVNLLSFSVGAGVLSLIILKLTNSPILAFTLSLLFSFHPANVESAVWPSSFSLYFPFSLLSLKFLFSERTFLSALFYSVALLFKESSLAIFPSLVLYSKGKWKFVFILITFAYFALRQFAVGLIPQEQEPHYDIKTLVDMFYGFGFYLKSTFFPFPFEVYLPEVPRDPLNLSFSFFGILITTFLYWKFKEVRPWILLFLSNVILHLSVVGFEKVPSVLSFRYLLLSLASLSVLLGIILRERIQPIALPLLVIFSIFSFGIIDTWKDDLSFWERAYSRNPKDATVMLNYASNLLSRGKDEEGLEILFKIFNGDYPKRDRFDAGVNIMAHYYNRGDFKGCAEFSERLESFGESDLFYYLKTLCFLGIGDTMKAKESIEVGISKFPHRPELRGIYERLSSIQAK